tara:strand:- start:3748 stop:3882 length:135 start_codon:yes stop_codon:yes gene_type:complete
MNHCWGDFQNVKNILTNDSVIFDIGYKRVEFKNETENILFEPSK